jgi:hypothetical protein
MNRFKNPFLPTQIFKGQSMGCSRWTWKILDFIFFGLILWEITADVATASANIENPQRYWPSAMRAVIQITGVLFWIVLFLFRLKTARSSSIEILLILCLSHAMVNSCRFYLQKNDWDFPFFDWSQVALVLFLLWTSWRTPIAKNSGDPQTNTEFDDDFTRFKDMDPLEMPKPRTKTPKSDS